MNRVPSRSRVAESAEGNESGRVTFGAGERPLLGMPESSAAQCGEYLRREPESGVLYQILLEHLETLSMQCLRPAGG